MVLIVMLRFAYLPSDDNEKNIPVNAIFGTALSSIIVFMQNVRFLANFITEAGILFNRSKVSSNPLQCSRLCKNDDLLRRKNRMDFYN
jgi:hypothetical protein